MASTGTKAANAARVATALAAIAGLLAAAAISRGAERDREGRLRRLRDVGRHTSRADHRGAGTQGDALPAERRTARRPA